MPSWQSYVIHPILRVTVKRKLARSNTAADARAAFGNALPAPKGARFAPDTVGAIAGEWAKSDLNGAGTLLYLHGGGYFACSPQTHRSITGAYAVRGFNVFAPAYRLAPETPFPGAVDDALATYRALLERVPAGRLAISGDSAGGGLALATMLAAKDAGLPMPACALLFSPWTDLAGTGASVVTNARRESMLYAPKLNAAASIYLNGAASEHPLASPYYGDLKGLPPLLIQVGSPEILLDDSTRLAARAQAAGVVVDLSIWDNVPHAWQVSQMFLPEARLAMDRAVTFAKAHLASGPADA